MDDLIPTSRMLRVNITKGIRTITWHGYSPVCICKCRESTHLECVPTCQSFPILTDNIKIRKNNTRNNISATVFDCGRAIHLIQDWKCWSFDRLMSTHQTKPSRNQNYFEATISWNGNIFQSAVIIVIRKSRHAYQTLENLCNLENHRHFSNSRPFQSSLLGWFEAFVAFETCWKLTNTYSTKTFKEFNSL